MMKVGVDLMSNFFCPSSRACSTAVSELLVGEAGVDLVPAQAAESRQLLERRDRVLGARPALLLGEEHLDEAWLARSGRRNAR